MAKTIHFIIAENGDVSIEVKGVRDSSCHELTRAFEEALGGGVKEVYEKELEVEETEKLHIGNT